MRIEVRLFARLRELVGAERMSLGLPEASTVADAVDALVDRHEDVAPLRATLHAAINRSHVSHDASLAEGDELALFPPVSGGSGETSPRILLDPEPLPAFPEPLPDTESGARVTFEGLVRGSFDGQAIERLHYEAYDLMAREQLTAVGHEAQARFDVRAVHIWHRTGDIGVGEAALKVSVVGSHRREAFEAAAWIVDEIKERVPIWKKELLIDGARWV
jgi:MoaE-MoaD fusion protein